MALRWEKCAGGRVPKDSVFGGWDSSKGEVLFVGKSVNRASYSQLTENFNNTGRGLYNGKYNPGKVHPSHGVCYIAFGDKEFACRDYEVLVNPGEWY